MKRSFTLFATVLSILALTNNSYGQCLTGGSFTASTNNPFDVNAEGFSGDFIWSANGSGQMESTGTDIGTTKIITSPTLFLPASATTICWSYLLGGTADVSSYIVRAKYNQGGVIQTIDVCSGGALTTTNALYIFAAIAPTQIIGQNFQLEITFNASASGHKIITVDNFKTNAFTSAIALPVDISYFNAGADAGKIKLTWLVAAESNVNRYEVEKSSNGKKWSLIGQVAATGVVQYNFIDANFSTGSNYYRLKAVDNNGSFKYSSVVLYKVGKSGIVMRAYPSPAKEFLTLEHNPTTGAATLDILSIDGKVLQTIRPVAGSVETRINLSSLNTGLYFIRYANAEGETETLKFIKQ